MKAKQTFHLYDPEAGENLVFEPGDDVPDHLAPLVSDAVVDGRPAVSPTAGEDNPFDGEAFDQAVEAKTAEVVDEAVQRAVDEYKAREQAAYEAAQASAFDPAADGVTAKQVHDYLVGLDRDTVAGAAEYERVVAAEQSGPNRSTAIPG